jgi:hypothetical protein
MSNISTMARADYALTATDILNGYFGVPVLWDSPFNDTNYNLTWSVHDTGQNFLSLDYSQGDVHLKTPSGFTAVVTLPASSPFIQGQETLINVNTSTDLSFPTSPLITTVYQVTFFYESTGADGNNTEYMQPTLTWTNPQGNIEEHGAEFLGPIYGGPWADLPSDESNIQDYSLPILALAGSDINVSTVFGGAYSFHYNLGIRIVQMPSNATVPAVGATVEIEAMASHR